jgi:hypothetical protein
MHRDGVDYVLVLMVHRRNIDSGTTMIGDDEQGFSTASRSPNPSTRRWSTTAGYSKA